MGFGRLCVKNRGFAFDHIFDHLQDWTTWKQCEQETMKAPFSD